MYSLNYFPLNLTSAKQDTHISRTCTSMYVYAQHQYSD